MIQRIQSVYLLLTTLISVLFLKGAILNFAEKSGSVIGLSFNGLVRESTTQTPELIDKNLPLSLIIMVILVVALLTIFLFKKRSFQMLLARILISLIIIFIIVEGWYAWNILLKYESIIVPGFKMILPVLQLILAILAYRGIKKDDDLVKSYDRLR